jgi:endonuclease YncB( thermonuclease family)
LYFSNLDRIGGLCEVQGDPCEALAAYRRGYGRLVAIVYVDGADADLEMLYRGLA